MYYWEIKETIKKYTLEQFELHRLYNDVNIYNHYWGSDFVIGILNDEDHDEHFLYIREDNCLPEYYFKLGSTLIESHKIIEEFYRGYDQMDLINKLLSKCIGNIGKQYDLR